MFLIEYSIVLLVKKLVFCPRYNGNLKSTTGFILSPPSLQLSQTITKYIHNLNKWSVTGK